MSYSFLLGHPFHSPVTLNVAIQLIINTLAAAYTQECGEVMWDFVCLFAWFFDKVVFWLHPLVGISSRYVLLFGRLMGQNDFCLHCLTEIPMWLFLLMEVSSSPLHSSITILIYYLVLSDCWVFFNSAQQS